MAQQILLSTTGTLTTIVINDLGARTFTHPVSNFNLLTEFNLESIRESSDLQSFITAGNIVLTDENANVISVIKDALENAKLKFDTDRNNIVDNAAQLNGQAPTFYTNRANHTGTQTASSISNFDTAVVSAVVSSPTIYSSGTSGYALNSSNAFTLGSQNGSFYLNRTNHTGTQNVSTISNLSAGTSGYAFNSSNTFLAANSTLLNSQAPSFYLSRVNHTGTQLSSTISDLTTTISTAITNGTSGYAFNSSNTFLATNSTLFNSQLPSFYLTRNNHTGSISSALFLDNKLHVLGDVNVQGKLYSTSGIGTSSLSVTSNINLVGDVISTSGGFQTQTGSITTTDGSFITTNGNIATTNGSISTVGGNISTSVGTVSGVNLSATTNATIGSNVNVGNNVNVVGKVFSNGLNSNIDINAQGRIYSTSGFSTPSTLNVAGTSTLGNVNVSTLNISSNINIVGQVFATGNINTNSNLNVQGRIYSTSGFSTPSTLNVTGASTLGATSVSTLNTSSNVNVVGQVFATANINGNSDLNVQGKIYSTSGFGTTASMISGSVTSGIISSNSNIFIMGGGSLQGTAGWASSSDNTHALKTATNTVDIWQSAAPTAGQFLIATSATTATWQNLINGEVGSVSSTAITNTTYGTGGANLVSTGNPASGTYIVISSAQVIQSTNNARVFMGVHSGGTLDANSERSYLKLSNTFNSYETILSTQAIVTVNGSQTIDVRFRVSSGTGTIIQRNMVYFKIA